MININNLWKINNSSGKGVFQKNNDELFGGLICFV